MAAMFVEMTRNPLVFLMIINVFLLFIGTFMETNAAIIILAPILFPVVMELGIDPIHFGIIMVVNLAIGMITPPLGVNIFVACGITKLKVEQIVSANWKFLFASIIALMLLTYFPGITMFLPNIMAN
jgi:C4-dicarboxylate transporter DctM subunit